MTGPEYATTLPAPAPDPTEACPVCDRCFDTEATDHNNAAPSPCCSARCEGERAATMGGVL